MLSVTVTASTDNSHPFTVGREVVILPLLWLLAERQPSTDESGVADSEVVASSPENKTVGAIISDNRELEYGHDSGEG